MTNFTYEININHEATITGVEGECPETLYIPSFIEVGVDKIKVTELSTRLDKEIKCRILYIPDTVQNVDVISNDYIHEIYLPDSLTEISYMAFCSCESLKKIHLPNNLKSIGTMAFNGCISLKEVSIPSTVENMDSGCFMGCSSLKSITIPSNVKELKKSTFEGCSNLREVVFLNDSIIFQPNTFKGCKRLSHLDDHLIEDGLLYNLDKTELYTFLGSENDNAHMVVPPSVRRLGYAFSELPDLVSVDLSRTEISEIYPETFKGCYNLQKVILPPTVKSIGDRAFAECTKLSEINLPDSIETMGQACFHRCALKDVTLPRNLTRIASTMFNGCKELVCVSIPLSVNTINSSAFSGCDMLEHVIIPKSFKDNLSKIFERSDEISFTFISRSLTLPTLNRSGAYTHGRLRPCPYCGSDDVTTFCDGTAECNDCGGEYTYQY